MALIVGGAAAVAVGLMYAIRRRARVDHFFIEVERGAGVFAFIGTAFAVLLAFVVLEAFESFNDAKTEAQGRRPRPFSSCHGRPISFRLRSATRPRAS